MFVCVQFEFFDFVVEFVGFGVGLGVVVIFFGLVCSEDGWLVVLEFEYYLVMIQKVL